MDDTRITDTAQDAYTERLKRLEGARWKRLLDVQAPYRWNIRRLELGFTLDVGCGIGRNLHHLRGHGIGVDHNPASVETCRARGLTAFQTDDFLAQAEQYVGRFDALLFAHLLEHVPESDLPGLMRAYLPFLRPGGRVVMITPQERGYRSDPTHVRFMGFDELVQLAEQLGLEVERRYSFPFPRFAGLVFPYNEFVVVARKR